MQVQMRMVMLLAAGLACHLRPISVDPPDGMEQIEILAGLADPASLAFSPDGRLFISERIQGRLRVAHFDASSDQWYLNSEPFYTFDVPADAAGVPERYRSSGLRGIAFDPNFSANRYVYCFYMNNAPRHNRVVRITASESDPDIAASGETLLLEVPFHPSDSSGSHNGGALAFGADGMLYITTGDGWIDGDDVQSLATFTGKVLRIAPDGSIPTDNPFYNQTQGDYRAIFALGLRNPYSIAVHPSSGEMYINDVSGQRKANVFQLSSGANYGHDGYDGIGNASAPWGNGGTSIDQGSVITGGIWYPLCGPFPEPYRGSYLTSLWGTNTSIFGSMTRIPGTGGDADWVFYEDAGATDPLGDLKPMSLNLGTKGWLYFLMSGYEADSGHVYLIRPSESGIPDVNGDGLIGVQDLLDILGNWGPCSDETSCPADVTGDCFVAVEDLLVVLGAWGQLPA